MTKTKHTIVAALFAAALTAGVSYAGTSVSKPEVALSKSFQESLNGSLETSVVSDYTYHGVKLDSNPVFIPQLKVQKSLLPGTTLQLGAQQVVGSSGSTRYRSQYNAGLAFQLDRVTIVPGYEVVAYPGRDGRNTQSSTLKVSFDDKGLTSYPLKPYVYTSRKLDPKAGNYYEVGVAPSTTLGALELTVPVAIGAGAEGYYDKTSNNVHYAFVSVGLAGEYHVNDRLSLKAGSTYYNTDNKLGNEKNSFLSSSVGVAVSF